jgi:hypothetical protein
MLPPIPLKSIIVIRDSSHIVHVHYTRSNNPDIEQKVDLKTKIISCRALKKSLGYDVSKS